LFLTVKNGLRNGTDDRKSYRGVKSAAAVPIQSERNRRAEKQNRENNPMQSRLGAGS